MCVLKSTVFMCVCVCRREGGREGIISYNRACAHMDVPPPCVCGRVRVRACVSRLVPPLLMLLSCSVHSPTRCCLTLRPLQSSHGSVVESRRISLCNPQTPQSNPQTPAVHPSDPSSPPLRPQQSNPQTLAAQPSDPSSPTHRPQQSNPQTLQCYVT